FSAFDRQRVEIAEQLEHDRLAVRRHVERKPGSFVGGELERLARREWQSAAAPGGVVASAAALRDSGCERCRGDEQRGRDESAGQEPAHDSPRTVELWGGERSALLHTPPVRFTSSPTSLGGWTDSCPLSAPSIPASRRFAPPRALLKKPRKAKSAAQTARVATGSCNGRKPHVARLDASDLIISR